MENKNLLLKNKQPTKYEIAVDKDDPSVYMEVWVKDISYFDIQEATGQLMQIKGNGTLKFDLQAYWRYAFTHWIIDTNPALTPKEILDLKGYVGDQIAKILPKPNEILEDMTGNFTNVTA